MNVINGLACIICHRKGLKQLVGSSMYSLTLVTNAAEKYIVQEHSNEKYVTMIEYSLMHMIVI